MNTHTGHIISFAGAIGIDSVLLLLGMKLIAGTRLSFAAALWTSFIACMLTAVISFGSGFVFPNHMGLAVLLAVIAGFFVQTVLFQVAVRAASQTLPAGRACLLSLLLISANFLVALPTVARIVEDFLQ